MKLCLFTRPHLLIRALSMHLPPVLWAWIRVPATHFFGARILTTLSFSTHPAASSALPQHLPPPLFFNCTVLPVPLSKGPYLGPVSRIVKYESFVIYDTRNWPLGRYGISIYVRACVRPGTLYLKGTRKEAEIYANSRTCCIADNSSAAYNRLTC